MAKEKSVRQATWAVLAIMATYAMSVSILSVLVNQLIEQFNLHGTAQGFMGSFLQVGNLTGALLLLLTQNRVRKMILLVVSGVTLAAALVWAGLSTTFFMFLAAYTVMGLGGAFLDSLTNAVIIDLHGQDNARYVGMLHGCYGIGSIVTPLLIQPILAGSSWRFVYILFSLPVLATALLGLRISSKEPSLFETNTGGPPQKLGAAEVKAYLSRGFNWAIIGALTFYMVGQFGLTTWVVRYMAVRFDAEQLGAIAVSLYWLCTTANRFVVPRLRVPPLRLVTVGLLLGAAIHILGVLSNNPIIMFIATAAIGVVSGHSIPMLISVGASKYPNHTALPTTIMLIVYKFGLILLPLALGAAAAVSINASMLLGGLCLAVAFPFAALAMKLDKPPQKDA